MSEENKVVEPQNQQQKLQLQKNSRKKPKQNDFYTRTT